MLAQQSLQLGPGIALQPGPSRPPTMHLTMIPHPPTHTHTHTYTHTHAYAVLPLSFLRQKLL